MKMSNKSSEKRLTLKGESAAGDWGALVCDGIMLAVFLWNQLYYGMNMLFLILPLAAIGVYLILFGVLPEYYSFGQSGLVIAHRFRKEKQIPYECVFNYEDSRHDGFINILQNNGVKVYYYTPKGKKAVAMCRPRDVDTFVEMLKEKCPEFHSDDSANTRLSVFFDEK